MTIGHTVTKPQANKCGLPCMLIRSFRACTHGAKEWRDCDAIEMFLDGVWCYSHCSCFKHSFGDYSWHHYRILRKSPTSQTTWHTQYPPSHYNDVIMSAIAPQITNLTIVYSNVYSRRRSKKTSKLRVTGLCAGNKPVTGELSAQRASNAENVSIWWRHHWPLLRTLKPNKAVDIVQMKYANAFIFKRVLAFWWMFCRVLILLIL